MIGAAALVTINYVTVRLVRRSRWLQRLLEGRADVLIRNGEIQKSHLNRELISKGELVAAAHKQGINSIHDVEHCVLEPTGTITFIQKRPTPDSTRHEQIMELLNSMSEEIKVLRAAAARSANTVTELQ
jgi:uncharacterized membrane protein YcaP (DUF421 family)